MASRAYKRLPGRKRGLVSSSALWEGSDHLLLVQSHVVIENYRRFSYRDIQAIVICRTKGGLITSLVLAAVAVACGVTAIFLSKEASIGCAVFSGLFLIAALIDILRGPTCRCTLRTAVQTQELPSLNRLRQARRALGLIQPKIASCQQEASTK